MIEFAVVDQPSNENSFIAHRRELEKILSGLGSSEPARHRIEAALGAPMLTIAEEMQLYDSLEERDEAAAKARTMLIDSHSSLAILGAWPFRNLGVPLVDLIDAAHESLIAAATNYTFPKTEHRSFFFIAKDAIEDGILNKLDDAGIEKVQPSELQLLYAQGKFDSINELMSPLDGIERIVLDWRFGNSEKEIRSLDAVARLWGSDRVQSVELRALRKLRRPTSK